MKYQGKELENFDLANFWRKYIYFQIKFFLKNKILEVGAGIGSFTKNYEKSFNEITLIEPDKYNFKKLKQNIRNKNIVILNTSIKKTKKKFNCIIYMNVLEHIRDHVKEINFAINKLNKNGFLVILVPAHQKLFTKFACKIVISFSIFLMPSRVGFSKIKSRMRSRNSLLYSR